MDASPNRICVMLMIDFFESEKQKWKLVWMRVFTAYNDILNLINMTQSFTYLNELNYLHDEFTSVDAEFTSIDATFADLRMIMTSL